MLFTPFTARSCGFSILSPEGHASLSNNTLKQELDDHGTKPAPVQHVQEGGALLVH